MCNITSDLELVPEIDPLFQMSVKLVKKLRIPNFKEYGNLLTDCTYKILSDR